MILKGLKLILNNYLLLYDFGFQILNIFINLLQMYLHDKNTVILCFEIRIKIIRYVSDKLKNQNKKSKTDHNRINEIDVGFSL